MDKIFIKECFLQKTNQFDALEVLFNNKDSLKLGTKICLETDSDLDKGETQVFAKLESDKNKTIGVLSEEDAKDIKPYIDTKRTDIFSCLISKYDKEADENKRVKIAIFVICKEDAKNDYLKKK